MKLETLTEKEFDSFSTNHPYASTYQVSGWGKLKKTTGWNYYLLGFKKNNQIICATLLLEKNTPIKRKIFYAPRGFLINYNDYELLESFTQELKIFIQKKKGFILKIDPNVIHMIKDNNFNDLELVDNKTIDNLTLLGYKHYGYNLNFETMQPRFLCRYVIKENYENTIKAFSKSTQKNIIETYKMGVKVRELDLSEIDIFMNLMNLSAKKNNFAIRTKDYYKKMYENLMPYSKIYLAYIDTSLYLKNVINNIKATEEELAIINNKIKQEKVGAKLTNQQAQFQNKLIRLNKDLLTATSLNKKDKYINIATLYSTFINNEGITFMSGIDNTYHKFNPKYALYDEHLKESIKRKLNMVNFYGISGDSNPNNPYYHIYEIKKGYNPKIIELIGEFDLILNKYYYYLYKISFATYTFLKRTKSRIFR